MRCSSVLFALLASSTAFGQASNGSFVRDGVKLYYTSEGSGKPLILLAGGPGMEPDYLKPAEEKLKSWRRCVLLEQRGTGRSQIQLKSSAFQVRQYVEDLEAMRKALKLRKLDLFGHSWGGMLAMAYAAAYPHHVGKLILCSSGGPDAAFMPTFEDNIGMRLTAEDMAEEKKWSSPDEMKKNRQAAADEALRAIVPGYFFDRSKALAFRKASKDLPKLINVGVNELVFDRTNLGRYNSAPGLRKLHCKTLIIQGKQDPVDESTGYQIHGAIHRSRLELLDRCGHFPWIEAPGKFWPEIHAFLTR
ncbi:MAG TPA: alpha/beta hydrolase [Fimbriimonas sp.]|nr:alpha/beta hydrolase [Fimbriimonas sp.]